MSAAVLYQQLTEFAADTEKELDALDDLTLDSSVWLLAGLRECLRDLKLIEKELEQHVIGFAGHDTKTFEVPNCGTVEVNWRKNRSKYQWDDLVKAIVAYAVEEPGVVWDLETGERVPPAVTAQEVSRVLRECVGFNYAKVTGLRKRGIDVDEYSESGPWQGTVRIVQ